MKKSELFATGLLFVITAIVIVYIYQAFANYLVTRQVCETTPMNQMTDKQWQDCLELLK